MLGIPHPEPRPTSVKSEYIGNEKLQASMSSIPMESLDFMLNENILKFESFLKKININRQVKAMQKIGNSSNNQPLYIEGLKTDEVINAMTNIFSEPKVPSTSDIARRDVLKGIGTTLAGGALGGSVGGLLAGSFSEKQKTLNAGAVLGFLVGTLLGIKSEVNDINKIRENFYKNRIKILFANSEQAIELADFVSQNGVDILDFFDTAMQIILLKQEKSRRV